MYPASIRRSRCSSGMVRCIGLLPTSFKDANSSLVSRVSRKEKEDKRLLAMSLDIRVKVLEFSSKGAAASWRCKATAAQSRTTLPPTPTVIGSLHQEQPPTRSWRIALHHVSIFGLVSLCQRFVGRGHSAVSVYSQRVSLVVIYGSPALSAAMQRAIAGTSCFASRVGSFFLQRPARRFPQIPTYP